ncbi:isopenicillin N synthase family oxygenase [Undibacterium jejuense]|uniref:2-oxoglutarate-dependent ethylene/succinate-forming enzyme n=1 Tax=Undibacterium jejuense TaxID=1344949 RepID=A0A923HCB0_9BURK|nr:isopenicillin N synthase family oxygenase [Undibacterium jejuense]MBC3861084.1 isopenicillin N synthase family oxygenase [Undibacterium jejuense]
MHIQPVDYRDPDAARKFTESLHQTGFGVLTNHPLSQNLLNTIYQEWYEFFQTDAKNQYTFDAEKMDGYFSPKISETAKGFAKRDLKEFYHVYPWGRVPSEVSNAAREYYVEGSKLAAELLQWVEDHTPAEIKAKYSMPLSDMITDSDLTLLRVLHYPPLRGDEEPDAVRAAAHGDINLLTVLPAATQAGLQVLGKDDAWHDVPCDFGMLIVNIGDMLDEASQGYYPSTIHRVLNPTGEEAKKSRISLPLFLHPRPDVVLSERHTSGSYLQERLRELGVKK